MQALHAPALHTTDSIAINVAPRVSVDALIDLVDAVPQAIGYWVDTPHLCADLFASAET
jgi:hypothetical protein